MVTKTIKMPSHEKLVEEFVNAEQIDPGRCDERVFKKGEFLCMLAGPRMWTIEAWVKKVAELSGYPVDWHFMGGRACVYYLGGEKALPKIIEVAQATQAAFEEAAQTLADEAQVDRYSNTPYPVQWLNRSWGVVPL